MNSNENERARGEKMKNMKLFSIFLFSVLHLSYFWCVNQQKAKQQTRYSKISLMLKTKNRFFIDLYVRTCAHQMAACSRSFLRDNFIQFIIILQNFECMLWTHLCIFEFATLMFSAFIVVAVFFFGRFFFCLHSVYVGNATK